MANLVFLLAIVACISFLYKKKHEIKNRRKVVNNFQKHKIQNKKEIDTIFESLPQTNATTRIINEKQNISDNFNLYYLAMNGLFVICLVYLFIV